MYTSGMSKYIRVEVGKDGVEAVTMTEAMALMLGQLSEDHIALVQAFLLYTELEYERELVNTPDSQVNTTKFVTNRHTRDALRMARRRFASQCEANRQIRAMEELS